MIALTQLNSNPENDIPKSLYQGYLKLKKNNIECQVYNYNIINYNKNPRLNIKKFLKNIKEKEIHISLECKRHCTNNFILPFIFIAAKNINKKIFLYSETFLDINNDLNKLNKNIKLIQGRFDEEIVNIKKLKKNLTFKEYINNINNFIKIFNCNLRNYEIEFQRRCSRKCKFCDLGYKYNEKIKNPDTNKVLYEIKYVYIHNKNIYFKIKDPNFINSKRNIKKIFKNLYENKIISKYLFYSRIKDLDEDIIKLLEKNKIDITIGIEHINDKILKEINKDLTKFEIIKKIKLINNRFNNIYLTFIYGFPFESINQFKENINFIKKINKNNLNPILIEFNKFPGSEYYNKFNKPNFDILSLLLNITELFKDEKNNVMKSIDKEFIKFIKKNKKKFYFMCSSYDKNIIKKRKELIKIYLENKNNNFNMNIINILKELGNKELEKLEKLKTMKEFNNFFIKKI